MERKRLHHFCLPHWHDYRVPRIVPARTARADVNVGSEDVDELAFAFVAPLRAQHDRYCVCVNAQ